MEKLIASTKIAVGAALLGFVAVAAADTTFGVHTGVLEGLPNQQTFDSDKISGLGSTLLTKDTVNNTIAGQGFIAFSSFQIPGTATAYSAFTTHLTGNPADNQGYLLWVEYSYTTQLLTGTLGGLNSTYAITSMTLSLWGEAANGTANNSQFVMADVNNVNSGKVTHSGDAIELGHSTMLYNGAAAINAAGGTSFTPTLMFELTNNGKSFFYKPDPFYDIAFGSFTNVATGLNDASGRIAVNNADGGVTFTNSIPEPTSVALVGIAVLGAGFAARRRKSTNV